MVFRDFACDPQLLLETLLDIGIPETLIDENIDKFLRDRYNNKYTSSGKTCEGTLTAIAMARYDKGRGESYRRIARNMHLPYSVVMELFRRERERLSRMLSIATPN